MQALQHGPHVTPFNFTPKTQDSNTKITKFQLFQQNPSWEAYNKLSLSTKYLIAARYYNDRTPRLAAYRTTYTRYQHLEHFENEFRKNPNLHEWQLVSQAIKEVILIKQKIKIINYVKNLQCDDENRLGTLFTLDSSIHQETKKYMSSYPSTGLDIIFDDQINSLKDGKLDQNQ